MSTAPDSDHCLYTTTVNNDTLDVVGRWNPLTSTWALLFLVNGEFCTSRVGATNYATLKADAETLATTTPPTENYKHWFLTNTGP